MPIKTTKPLTTEQLLAYRLVLAVRKFIDPGLGFRSIRMIPGTAAEPRCSFHFSVPVQSDPEEPRSLRVEVRGTEVRVDFRRNRRGKSETFDVSDPAFERNVAEFIGKQWNCFFSTYWMSL